MHWPEENYDASSEDNDQVRRGRPPRAVQQGVLKGIIHVELRRQKSRKDEHGSGNRGLQRQGPAIVAEDEQSPKQHDGQADVEAGKQSQPQGVVGVPHIFRPANEVAPGHNAPGDVQAPQNSDKRRKERLARNQQGIPEP